MRTKLLTAVLFAAALGAGCAQTDVGVTTSVKTRLAADDLVKARKIDVDTKNHVVTLSGQVQSTQEQTRAMEIAKATKGVTAVVDQLAVVPAEQTAPTTGRYGETLPTASEPTAYDPGITAEVKTKLLADPSVSGLKINVDTHERVVTLAGTVGSQAEKDRAIAIARDVKNVDRVDDQLKVRK